MTEAQTETQKDSAHKPMPFKQEMALKAKSGVKDGTLQLAPGRFHEAQYRRMIWGCYVEPGTTLDQIMKPEFWAHSAAKVKQDDKIEVKWDDGSHYAELLVISAGPTWVQVHKLRYEDLGGKNIPAAPDFPFEVRWGGGHHKFRVIRKSDGSIIQDGLPNKDAAELAMKEYAKTVQAA